MKIRKTLLQENSTLARKKWPSQMGPVFLQALRSLTERHKFSISSGDLILLENHWYVTHTGLIRLARRSRCVGIHAEAAHLLSNPASSRWAFKATVYRSQTCKGFVGYGDADPSNVSPLVHGAEMRVAETRAVNRALRKAYGIGICSVEEIGSFAEPVPSSRESKQLPPQPVNGKNGNYGGPKVRDRLCQLIRQHQLDANLVKSYAVDFCGTKIPPGGHPRAGRRLCRPPGRLGRERPQCPALPAQQLSSSKGRRCGMRRYFESLRPADVSAIHSVPDGIFLVRVDRAQYRWHKQKPYYEIRFAVLKPRHLTGCFMTGRLYCTPRAMWKLSWFLRDFGYDAELLGKNEIDDKALIDLWGVVKVSEVTVHGISLLNFDGFAPAGRWEELSVFTDSDQPGSEVSS